MQDALESLFGPAAGLIGMVTFAIILAPKFVARWKGYRARKREEKDRKLQKVYGSRALHIDPAADVSNLDDHPIHGIALMQFHTNIIPVFIEMLVCVIPLTLVMAFVPPGYHSLRIALLVVTIPTAIGGLWQAWHFKDSAVFYRTGCEIHLKGKRLSIDYNDILSFTERKSLIPGGYPEYIIHLIDGTLFVLDTKYYKSGRGLNHVLDNLGVRIIKSVADENMHRL